MEAQNLHFMGAEGLMKTKFTDGLNPTKTRAHSRMSNAPLLVTEPFLPRRARSSQRSFCRPLTADTSEHPTTHHIASYMYALKISSTETLQLAL